jgi:DNA-binding NarL/FixJ family response regulator
VQHAFEHHSARTIALTHQAMTLVEQCAALRDRQVRLLTRLRATVADFRLLRAETAETLGQRPRFQARLVRPGSPNPDPWAPGPAVASASESGPEPLDLARYRLTRRELQVADLLASGLSNAAVAESLGISEHTARHHTESVLAKLGVRSRAEAGALVRGWYAGPVAPARRPA